MTEIVGVGVESDRVLDGMISTKIKLTLFMKQLKDERNSFLKTLRDKGFSGREYSDAVVQYDVGVNQVFKNQFGIF